MTDPDRIEESKQILADTCDELEKFDKHISKQLFLSYCRTAD